MDKFKESLWSNFSPPDLIQEAIFRTVSGLVGARWFIVVLDILIEKGLMTKDFMKEKTIQMLEELRPDVLEKGFDILRPMVPDNISDGDLRKMIDQAYSESINKVIQDLDMWVKRDG